MRQDQRARADMGTSSDHAKPAETGNEDVQGATDEQHRIQISVTVAKLMKYQVPRRREPLSTGEAAVQQATSSSDARDTEAKPDAVQMDQQDGEAGTRQEGKTREDAG